MNDSFNSNYQRKRDTSVSEIIAEEDKPGNFVLRQELESTRPPCNFKLALFCNLILCLIFLFCGLPNILVHSNLNYITIDYTDEEKW